MSIRLFLICMVALCLLGGYCLDQIQLLWNTQYQKKSEAHYVVNLSYRESINLQKNISQFIVSLDLVISTENTYLAAGTLNFGDNLLLELNSFHDSWLQRSLPIFDIEHSQVIKTSIEDNTYKKTSKNRRNKVEKNELSFSTVSNVERSITASEWSLKELIRTLNAISENGMDSANLNLDDVERHTHILYEMSEAIVLNIKKVNEYCTANLIFHEEKLLDFKLISWSIYLLILLAAWVWANYSVVLPINNLSVMSEKFRFGDRFLGVSGGFKEVNKLSQSFTHLANRLIAQSLEDPLTGLNNRRAFDQKMDEVFSHDTFLKEKYALCFVDVDDFKLINDTYGHQTGDKALQHLSEQLSASVRHTDFVFRIGGDEFSILLKGYNKDSIYPLVERIRNNVFRKKIEKNGNSVALSISVGVVRLNGSIPSVKQAIMAANHACKFSKEAGKNSVSVLDYDDPRLFKEYKVLANLQKLKVAMALGEVDIFAQKIMPLQPITDKLVTLENQSVPYAMLQTQRLPRYEVLSRFSSKACQDIDHFELITLAETYGLSPELDMLILSKVFSFLHNHPNIDIVFESLHINLSASSVGNDKLKAFILSQLDCLPISSRKISFEITETSAMKDRGQAIDFINSIKERGCTFSLDDFGSGMCSFAYLKDFPVDIVKIDGQFVKNMEKEASDYAIVEAINRVAQSSDKQTIAEYVETEGLATLLTSLGVDYAQGYYYHKPEMIEQAIIMPSDAEILPVKLRAI